MRKFLYGLQFFADGGDGGSAAAPGDAGNGQEAAGVKADDPGRQRLRELGVPEAKIRKNRAYAIPKQEPAKPSSEAQRTEETEGQQNTQDKPSDSRMTWEQIKSDPEYSKALKADMSATVQSRLKEAKAAEQAYQNLTPALEVLAKKYGMDPAQLDPAALGKAIMEDNSLYDDKALELGVSNETARKLEQYELQKARDDRQAKESAQQEMYRQHFDKLVEQGKALKEQFPEFDLQAELQNPVFARMTAPGNIFSVEDAYYHCHRKEIMAAQAQQTAQQTAQSMSNAMLANANRPRESGSNQAPSVPTFDVRNMSRAQRESVKKQVQQAAAMGKKIGLNDIKWG